MNNENIIRTPDTRNIETPIINEGVLNQEPKLDNKFETLIKSNLVNESSFVIKKNLVNKTKRTCVNALNQRLYNLQKKDKIKNRAIIFTIFFSVGIIGFIAGYELSNFKSFLIISEIEISFFIFCLYRLNLFCPGYIISFIPLIFGSFLIV